MDDQIPRRVGRAQRGSLRQRGSSAHLTRHPDPGRSAQERVRNPSLMGLAAARTDMIRPAKAIALVDPKPDQDGIEVDRFLEEVVR